MNYKRDKIIQAAANIEGSAVLLPERWNDALIGYTIKEDTNTVIGVYDYNRAVQLPPGIDLDDCLVLEDALLDDLRAIENLAGKEFKPVLVRTWQNLGFPFNSPRRCASGSCDDIVLPWRDLHVYRRISKMNPIDVYIQNGYEVKNALIENADITTEEYPTVNIQLKLPGGGVVFGGYSFAHVTKGDFKLEGWEKGMTAIFRIMEVAGVNHWNKLKGSPVRAILKDQRIYAIAHFLEDKVMDYRLAPFQEKTSL